MFHRLEQVKRWTPTVWNMYHKPGHVIRTRDCSTLNINPTHSSSTAISNFFLFSIIFPSLLFSEEVSPAGSAPLPPGYKESQFTPPWLNAAGEFYNLIKCRTYSRAVSKVAGLSRPGLVPWLDFIQSVRVGPVPSSTPSLHIGRTSDKSKQREDYASSRRRRRRRLRSALLAEDVN